MGEHELVTLTGRDVDPNRALEVLNTAYGTSRFTAEWYRWKHKEGPWGPSTPVLISDLEGQDLGTVFVLPWHLRCNGELICGVRFVDGGTTPAARRHGVFSRLIRTELERWRAEQLDGVLIATATPPAQASHIKNGATALPPIRYAYGPPRRYRRAQRSEGPEILDHFTPIEDGSLSTDWTPDALRWRLAPASQRDYRFASLDHSDHPNGLAYRVEASKLARVLVPIISWGRPEESSVLLGATARAERCAAVLALSGPGARESFHWSWWRRGSVLMCVWDMRSRQRPPASELSSWRVSPADVEGVM